MSKAKKIALSLLAVVALVAGGKAYKNHREGLPVLAGHCYVNPKDGSAILIAPKTQVLKDKEGKDVEVYVALMVVGPFRIPQALDIRKANKILPELAAKGEIEEVNCETGEPLSK